MESMGLRNRIAPLPKAMISQIKSTKAWYSSHSKLEVKLEMSHRMEIPWLLKALAVAELIKVTLQMRLERTMSFLTEVNLASWNLIIPLG